MASIEKRVFKGASWLGIFKLISQIFSWLITILVARILVPDDYGLMEMATVITGYAAIFSELGLGAAIIQKDQLKTSDLSSIFWFALLFSAGLGVFCIFAAYPTAMIFNDNRVIPLTQSVSILFIISGLQIVPMNLLKKKLRFKAVGFLEMSGVIVSSSAMLLFAKLGFGAWTLILGHMIRNFTKMILAFSMSGWFPQFHFKFKETVVLLKFGITVAAGRSLFYLYEKSDRFFAGRAWNSVQLGLYSFALQLAAMPTEKIVVLINQVSFSAFSQLQHDKEKFNKFYLNIAKFTATVVIPIFLGLFSVGEDVVKTLLNPKWYPMIMVFRFLCLAQIMTAINAINNFVHTAKGKPVYSLYYNGILAVLMPIGFYFSVKHGFEAILIPWLTIYIFVNLIWSYFTLKILDIRISKYIKALSMPFFGSSVMTGTIFLYSFFINRSDLTLLPILSLIVKITVGAITYMAILFLFDKDFIRKSIKMIKSKD